MDTFIGYYVSDNSFAVCETQHWLRDFKHNILDFQTRPENKATWNHFQKFLLIFSYIVLSKIIFFSLDQASIMDNGTHTKMIHYARCKISNLILPPF